MAERIITSGSGDLAKPAEVKLDANGNGTVELVAKAGTEWLIYRAIVSCTGTNNPMPTFRLYDGFPNAGNQLDATWTGGMDQTDFPNPLILRGGESIIGIWSGGVPGSKATLRLVGVQQSA